MFILKCINGKTTKERTKAGSGPLVLDISTAESDSRRLYEKLKSHNSFQNVRKHFVTSDTGQIPLGR